MPVIKNTQLIFSDLAKLLNDELIVFKEAQIRVKYLLEIK